MAFESLSHHLTERDIPYEDTGLGGTFSFRHHRTRYRTYVSHGTDENHLVGELVDQTTRSKTVFEFSRTIRHERPRRVHVYQDDIRCAVALQ